MNDKLTLTGYVSVREFGGYALPVPIQNKLLRTYCNENDFIYRLPLNETYLPENYMYLFNTIDRVSDNSNIGMCSIHMFPKDNRKFVSLMKKISKKNLNFHFIFDNSVISSDDIGEYYLNSRLRYIDNIDLELIKDFMK